MPKLPRFRVNAAASLLLTIPLALISTILALYIQPGSIFTLLRYYTTQPLLAFLNFLPFWLLTLGAAFLMGNPFWASALVGGIGGVLSLVNRTMVEKRDEPLSPKDFALIKEAGNAMQSYDMSLHIPSVLCIVLFILAMVGLGLMFRGERPFKKLWMNASFAAVGCAASLGVLVGCVQGVYSSKDLYNSFPVRNRYYITSVYEELGFPYCFCYNFNTYLVDRPQGFSPQEAAAYAMEYPAVQGEGRPVNVIMVMNEAFSDITDFEAFGYSDRDDPLSFYHSLEGSKRAVTGHIVVPNFGAGTANTEFDVITGMQTNMISESGASAFRVLNRDIDSIFRVFLDDGYHTEFIHPGQDWFYNRQNVYKYFGAQELLFQEEFADAKRKGNWVTDEAVFQVLKAEFEEAMEAGEQYFNYTVTIQNHMSYSEAKYGDYIVPEAPLTVEVEDKARTMLSVYAEGVRDSDRMLREMTEYFEGREEPVVLVFFGDHLPNLGDSYYGYRQMGMELGEGRDAETTLRAYSTPYVIWANAPAAEMLDMAGAAERLGLPEDRRINANYLGGMVLELTGRGEADSFFSFNCRLRRELPILRNGTGRGREGEYFEDIPEEYLEDVRKLRFWEYYRLKVE